MKRRSKEINIFSISALDLFASGMGAFILITIILIPYFPNEAPPEEVVAALKAERDTAQARVDGVQTQLDLAQANLQECRNNEDQCLQNAQALEAQIAALTEQLAAAQNTESGLQQCQTTLKQCEIKQAITQAELDEIKNAPKLQFPPLDLVIALDSTRSMGDEVAGIKSEIRQLLKLLTALSADVGIGIINFKDRCDFPSVTAFPLQKMTSSNLSSISRFTNGITTGSGECNEDQPEAFAQALSKAVSMPWRSVTKVKVIVIITDNPAYPEFENKAIASARRFASQGAGFHVSTVHANNVASEPNTVQFLKSVARAGKGEFVGGGGGSFTATILLAIAGI